jgi:hypothetical protein
MAVNDPRDPRYDPAVPGQEYRPREIPPAVGAFNTNEETLRRVSGLINLAAMVVNGLIALRFLLKLLAANPANPFAALVYFLSGPFVAIFVGLTPTPSFQGIQIEFFDLIAILVYFLLAWAIIRLLWILFARLNPTE